MANGLAGNLVDAYLAGIIPMNFISSDSLKNICHKDTAFILYFLHLCGNIFVYTIFNPIMEAINVVMKKSLQNVAGS